MKLKVSDYQQIQELEASTKAQLFTALEKEINEKENVKNHQEIQCDGIRKFKNYIKVIQMWNWKRNKR